MILKKEDLPYIQYGYNRIEFEQNLERFTPEIRGEIEFIFP